MNTQSVRESVPTSGSSRVCDKADKDSRKRLWLTRIREESEKRKDPLDLLG